MHKARRRDTTRSCVYQATRAKRTRADRGLPVATKSTRKLAVLGDTRPPSIAGSLRPERNVRRLLPLPTVCRLASLPPRISDPVVGKKERKRQAEAHLHPSSRRIANAFGTVGSLLSFWLLGRIESCVDWENVWTMIEMFGWNAWDGIVRFCSCCICLKIVRFRGLLSVEYYGRRFVHV